MAAWPTALSLSPQPFPAWNREVVPEVSSHHEALLVQGRRVQAAQGYRSHPFPVRSKVMFAWLSCLVFLFLAARRLPKGTRVQPKLLLALLFMLSYCSVDDVSCARAYTLTALHPAAWFPVWTMWVVHMHIHSLPSILLHGSQCR